MSEIERNEGGQPGNLNAAKKLLFPENVDLDKPESVLAFQKQVIRDLYEGKLGSRAAGSINHALENLLKFYLDSKKLAQYEEYFQRIKTMLDRDEAQQKTEAKSP